MYVLNVCTHCMYVLIVFKKIHLWMREGSMKTLIGGCYTGSIGSYRRLHL